MSNSTPVEQAVLDENGNIDIDNNTQLHINRTNLNGNKITDRGFIIEASDDIYVSIRVSSSFTNSNGPIHWGALVSKGNSALGTEFRLGGLYNEPSVPNSHTMFGSFMATENNTTVSIIGLPSCTQLPSGIPVPDSITLD